MIPKAQEGVGHLGPCTFWYQQPKFVEDSLLRPSFCCLPGCEPGPPEVNGNTGCYLLVPSREYGNMLYREYMGMILRSSKVSREWRNGKGQGSWHVNGQ